MPYAIELYLDGEASAMIGKIHSTLRNNGIHIDEGTSPHVSLCIYQDLPLDEFEGALRRFAGELRPFDVTFPRVDAFRTAQPVIFLAPEAGTQLLDVHERFHNRFRTYRERVWQYYRPGVWVPHCTLCMDLSQEMFQAATRLLKDLALPIHARFERIGILEFHPNKQLSVFDLGEM